MRGRLFAWLLLAWRMSGQMLSLPLRPLRRGRGAARLLAQLAPEGYVPLDADERARFPAFMRCISCGLCALACPALHAAPARAWDEAWTFVAGAARMLDRSALAASALEPCARCDACAAVCPTGVPIPALAALVTRLASERPT